jgi:hypothetical protein
MVDPLVIIVVDTFLKNQDFSALSGHMEDLTKEAYEAFNVHGLELIRDKDDKAEEH